MNGKIVRWVDERGFGFINSDELEGDVFVHISKFTDGYRRPQVGDEVEFQLSNSGSKLSASSAKLVGIETSKSNPLSFLINPSLHVTTDKLLFYMVLFVVTLLKIINHFKSNLNMKLFFKFR